MWSVVRTGSLCTCVDPVGVPFCYLLQVQFAYSEAGVQKAALVKLRVCPKHALQLNYQKNQHALQVSRLQHVEHCPVCTNAAAFPTFSTLQDVAICWDLRCQVQL